MNGPVFLSLDEIITIHHDQVTRYGGHPGIRDIGLLKSTVAMPAATFDGEFLHTDIHQMAAAYLFHIVRNHPFIDGNKRTGAVAAIVFLVMNGIELTAGEDELHDMVMAAAEGKLSKTDITAFLQKHSTK